MSRKVINPMADIFKYLAISILFMFMGLGFGIAFVPDSFVYMANKIIMFLSIGLLLLALFSRKRIIPSKFSMSFVYLFTFIDGILLYPILKMYIQGLGTSLVMSVLLGTVVIFMVLYFVSSKKEPGYYLGFGRALFISLFVLLLLSILGIFIGGKTFNIILSLAGIVIFSGYILYDISLIRYDISRGYIVDRNDLSIYVLNLYIDFINIFIDLLYLIWELKD